MYEVYYTDSDSDLVGMLARINVFYSKAKNNNAVCIIQKKRTKLKQVDFLIDNYSYLMACKSAVCSQALDRGARHVSHVVSTNLQRGRGGVPF